MRVPTRTSPASEMSGPMSTTTSRSTRCGAWPAKAIATRPPIDSPTIEARVIRRESANAVRSADSAATV